MDAHLLTDIAPPTPYRRRKRRWALIVVAIASVASSPVLVVFEFVAAVVVGLSAVTLAIRRHARSAKKYGELAVALLAGPAAYFIAWCMVLFLDNG